MESVLASTNATEEDRRDFDRTMAKFDAYFNVRKKEPASFNRIYQQSGETLEQYIMVLFTLSKHCEYGDMTEEMIRDRLVVDIQDNAQSQIPQLDLPLTLESAKKAIHQREVVYQQQQSL